MDYEPEQISFLRTSGKNQTIWIVNLFLCCINDIEIETIRWNGTKHAVTRRSYSAITSSLCFPMQFKSRFSRKYFRLLSLFALVEYWIGVVGSAVYLWRHIEQRTLEHLQAHIFFNLFPPPKSIFCFILKYVYSHFQHDAALKTIFISQGWKKMKIHWKF